MQDIKKAQWIDHFPRGRWFAVLSGSAAVAGEVMILVSTRTGTEFIGYLIGAMGSGMLCGWWVEHVLAPKWKDERR